MKRLLSTFALLCASAAAWAQYTIYPVPQKMTAQEGTASFSGNVCVVCDAAIDQPTKNRAQQVLNDHGLTADFTNGEQQCTSVIYLKVDPEVAVKGKYDAHNISLQAMSNGMASLTITGQNTDATFMGLASLEQMLDAQGTTALPCVLINDYADQQQRGIVEGYYGYPYSVEVKKDLMRFMMRMKMNSYMYGAKSDPYHLSQWQTAYPKNITDEQKKNGWLTQDMVQEICDESAATKVNFIWSIHPGTNIITSPTVVSDIMKKYQMMYELGVRQFGLFVDDVGVPDSQEKMDLNAQRVTELQAAIEQKWNQPGAEPADTVKPLNFVPQIYCRSFANNDTQYKNFFTALASTPKHVIIYTTGNGVWSVPNANDFNAPKQFLGRDVAWWWNYPCNDNADSQIYPMDMYQNFADMPAVTSSSTLPRTLGTGIGIVSNPMQQGEVAKIPLFSVADYAWNHAKFVNKTSWAAAFPFILRDETKANALKALAPYLTKNDPSGKFPATSDSKTLDNIAALLDNIEVVKSFADSGIESEELLWRDLQPWVLKLEQMLHTTEKLLAAKKTTTERDERWDTYTEGVAMASELDSKEEFIAYTLEGMHATVGSPHMTQPAAKYLGTYISNLKTTSVKDLFAGSSTSKAAKFSNTAHTATVTTNGNDIYVGMTPNTLNPGDYMGIALPLPTRIKEMLAVDTLVQNHAVLISPNGREWTRLEPTGSDTRTLDSYIKYIVVGNESDAPVTLKLTKNVLRLTQAAAPTVSSITAPVEKDYNERANIFDGDVTTFWAPYQNQATGDVIRLNLSEAAPIRKVRFVVHNTNDDYMKTGRIEISEKETTGYKRLPIEGTTKTSFTLADMTPLHNDGTPYGPSENKADASIYQLYFDASGQTARYIRFYNQSANTSKWIRIAEFTADYDVNSPSCLKHPEVCDGLAYTAALAKAGEVVEFDPQTAYDVDKVEVFTNHGILTAEPDTDGKIYIDCDADTIIYEVIVTTTKTAPSLFGTTSIRDITADSPSRPSAVYDITGRKVQQPKQGLYIVNGKKVIF